MISLLIALLVCGNISAAEISVSTRKELAEMLTRIVGREVSGANVKIQAVKRSRGKVGIYATAGLSYYPFRPANVAAMRDSVRMLLPREFHKSKIEIFTDGREIAGLIPMAYDKESIAMKITPFVNRSQTPLVTRLSVVAPPEKGLAGRHIALWQSHGRYFDQSRNGWRWQRSQLWQTCEDLYTQSYVLPYLVPMLENAGACVLLPRERDVQRVEVLADNDDSSQYAEQGTWSAGGVGFAHIKQVYHGGENPFRDGTTRSVQSVKHQATAEAEWQADIPETGEYAVYVSYEASPESVEDARYTVHHAGGESCFAVNQTMGGGTWIYLGRFRFMAGKRPLVTLSNVSHQAGRRVSADAVKIGGGFGNIARSVHETLQKKNGFYSDETSGYPRFCEGARYWLQWAGFDEKVYTPKENLDDYKDDYMSRAHWVNALMGGSERLPDSVGLHIPIDMALAFHSDAGVRDGDGIVGTLGIFFTQENKGKFVGGADRYRSRDLTDLVQTQIVADIRRTYEPLWSRRGMWNRSYYEARVPSAPTMLLELLSHQNFADMRYGSDPRFKFLVSRAIYKGILRYLCSQYRQPYVVQPLPIEAFRISFEGEDNVRLSWRPSIDSLEKSALPKGYIVYTRIGSNGFDNGRYTTDSSFITKQTNGEIYSYKITAVNAGGESFPSETLAACRVADSRGTVLVVNGFNRVSAPLSMRCDTLAGFETDVDGGVPDKQDISFIGMQRVFDLFEARSEVASRALGASESDYETDVIGGNTFDYPALHGRSIVKAGYSFCSTSAAAVERGVVLLTDYRAVDLILGKQRATYLGGDSVRASFRAFPDALQRALRDFKRAGGGVFVSGCYVLSDLTTDEERAFARDVLHALPDGSHESGRARVRVVTSHAGFSRGEYAFSADYSPVNYHIERVDAMRPESNQTYAVMRYVDGNRIAAVAGEKSYVMGFPFESLSENNQRDRLMRDILKHLFK